MTDDELFLETDAEVKNAKPEAAAAVFEALAQALRESPSQKRYDIYAEVDERE